MLLGYSVPSVNVTMMTLKILITIIENCGVELKFTLKLRSGAI
jgi:hypothetical protein